MIKHLSNIQRKLKKINIADRIKNMGVGEQKKEEKEPPKEETKKQNKFREFSG